MEPLYLPVKKSGLLSVRSNQASNVTLVLVPKKSNELNEVVITKGATAKLIVGC
jgi:hypothetical protein